MLRSIIRSLADLTRSEFGSRHLGVPVGDPLRRYTAVGLWTPEYLDTALWLDAADEMTITDVGGAVSQWDDKSGHARHATQGTGADQPTSGTNTIGNKNAIAFDGTEHLEILFAIGTVKAAFVVYESPTIIDETTGNTHLLRDAGVTGISLGPCTGNLANEVITVMQSGINRRGVNDTGLTGGQISAAAHVYSITFDTDWRIGLDGSSDLANLSNGTQEDYDFASPLYIGAHQTQSPEIIGDIAEIVLINVEVSTQDRERVEGYLAHKWNISLAAGHRYENTAPVYSNDWTPEQITTALWLDAADVRTITEVGGAVSQWDDKSGNDYHATQGTGGLQPTTSVSQIGTKNAIYFDGSEYFTGAHPIADVQAAFIVYKADAVLDENAIAHPIIRDGTPEGFTLGASTTHLTDEVIAVFEGFSERAGVDNNAIPGGEISADGHIYSFNWTSTAWDIMLDGSSNLKNIENGTQSDLLFDNPYYVGVNHGLSTFAEGAIAEIILITDTLSDVGRMRIEGYLAHKWGIELALGHPYKDDKPLLNYAFTIALVVGNDASLTVNDTAIKDLLEINYNVTVHDDTDNESLANSVDAVVIAESVTSGNIAARYLTTTTPVLTTDAFIYDDMNMVATLYGLEETQTQVDVTGTGDMAAGLSGVTTVSGIGTSHWGTTGGDAVVFATVVGDSTKHTVFRYDTGDTLGGGGTAAGKRVGFFAGAGMIRKLNTDGDNLFNAAIAWLLE